MTFEQTNEEAKALQARLDAKWQEEFDKLLRKPTGAWYDPLPSRVVILNKNWLTKVE